MGKTGRKYKEDTIQRKKKRRQKHADPVEILDHYRQRRKAS